MMKMVPEDLEFGLMRWRLLSREVVDGRATTKILVLPITGVGTYMRTVIMRSDGPCWEEPILLKQALVLEVVVEQRGSGLVDAGGRAPEPEFKCVNRELIGVDVAKKRFQPKGSKHSDLEIVPGSLLTQEQRPQVQSLPPEFMKKIAAAEAAAAANQATKEAIRPVELVEATKDVVADETGKEAG